jgi:hypothetical protein
MRPILSAIARAEINRATAQHSTGPKTEAGKQRSALNALRHGLQLKRKIEENQQFHQASVLLEMHQLKEEPYDPSDDGFVFSEDEFHAYMHKNNIAERAARADEYCQEEAEYA